jgi:small subunit ribosomal protein S8
MINDLIADSITRIRNGAMRKLQSTQLVHSNITQSILEVLKDKEYIENFKIDGDIKKTIKVTLKYDNDISVINELKRISKPGRRVYKNASELKNFKSGRGIIIVSTNKGVMSNYEAFKQNVGGELLCSIW